ncbi:hypothetical protein [Maribacter sp. 2307UL18-2]|uniref:hypothetical protein n=1 Tax=Maribacter sp. 2307UL18-2 TaxID=3386274 RepID=UPI0039BC5349
MKITITIFTLVAALFSQLSFAKARIPIPYGTADKIIKMVDLPDQEEFQLEDGRYFDIGSYYTINHIVWLAYSSSEPQIVGYVEDSDEYLVFTPEELKQIAEIANVEIPAEAEVSFMHSVGGKIILGIIGLFVIHGIYSSYFSKDQEEEKQHDSAETA